MGHDAIEDVAYRPPAGQAGEVEVHTVDDLLGRASPGLFDRPQRMGFHQVMLIEHGAARHMVDFAEHRFAPGTVLWVRPGQVQLWEDPTRLEGTVLLFPGGSWTRTPPGSPPPTLRKGPTGGMRRTPTPRVSPCSAPQCATSPQTVRCRAP
ncbi:AraC family ligand binding domain-containing protein [Nesterenkonia sp. PF2B19]|uniref:AraC family ligand binding domain-containing protein n=1 Tax=Nesterenkonia sp. PF2B19 TaxID=1881858 RepID=UPI001481E566|nr:AraC family ligand binding domain-containing protein [Nesterenkonia sp. PF2B19]